MQIKAFAGAILALSVSTVSAKGFACNAPEPSHDQIEDARAFYTAFKAGAHTQARARAPFAVNTYVHVVAASTSKYITQTQVNNQIKALNTAYAPHDISFKLVSTDFTTNSGWAQDSDEMAMKKKLRKGAYKDLNLYFVETPADGALGYCYFPVSNPSSQDLTTDGCTIMAQSVPGGTAAPYNLGGTAIHEVGHWMNLFHTFQGGCTGGDSIDDTPAQASASSGCPTGRDSCPNKAGVDPIHNYMDYSDDKCYTEFTAGQDARMHNAWENFRQ
ncbi:metalloprotease [Microdochium bolleyi]|uniref:Metalloprotease n=1 Tax=Microdochium bolleyi TaxID=196109 RepID=A0A136JFY7_9PEZI|nr:metalloprotease [Microdochium bolleyi]